MASAGDVRMAAGLPDEAGNHSRGGAPVVEKGSLGKHVAWRRTKLPQVAEVAQQVTDERDLGVKLVQPPAGGQDDGHEVYSRCGRLRRRGTDGEAMSVDEAYRRQTGAVVRRRSRSADLLARLPPEGRHDRCLFPVHFPERSHVSPPLAAGGRP